MIREILAHLWFSINLEIICQKSTKTCLYSVKKLFNNILKYCFHIFVKSHTKYLHCLPVKTSKQYPISYAIKAAKKY